MEPLVKVQCLKHVYPDKTEVCLCGLDFVVNPGERIVILGPNGSGKTTLLSHILGLLAPVDGNVEVMGLKPHKNFNTIRKNIGVVFQNVDEQIIGPRVYDDIAFTPRNQRLSKEEVAQRVKSIANTLGIESLLDKIPHYLSGGQKKKVALAGAVVMTPKILIMDEPFDSLDPKSKREIMIILNKLNKDYGITLIITTHDINLVNDIADTVYVINDGKIVTKGTPKEVFNKAEILQKASLESPILTELFDRLRKRGIDVEVPSSMEEAENILYKVLSLKGVS